MDKPNKVQLLEELKKMVRRTKALAEAGKDLPQADLEWIEEKAKYLYG